MTPLERGEVRPVGNPLGRELADRVEHPEARAPRRGENRSAAASSCPEATRGGASRPPPQLAVADRLRCLQRRAAFENRQPARAAAVQAPSSASHRPLQRRAQRPLPRGQVSRPSGQQVEPILETFQKRGQRQQSRPVGGQLDRERQAVQACADGIDDGAVVIE